MQSVKKVICLKVKPIKISDSMQRHKPHLPRRAKKIKRALFPVKPRLFPGQRWINICLRSAHLVGVAGIGGGFLFQLNEAQWLLFWYLGLTTGVLLSLLYIWSGATWLFQLSGLTIVAKVVLLGIAMVLPAWRAELFALIIVISSLIAHAPGQVRGYRIIMRSKNKLSNQPPW